MKSATLFVALLTVTSCFSARILSMVPMPSKSHCNLFETLVIELAKKGHEVVHISSFKLPATLPNLKEITIPSEQLHKVLVANIDTKGENNMFSMRNMSPWLMNIFMPMMGDNLCNVILQLPEVQDLIKSDQKFDLVLGEIFVDESMLAGFSHKFKAPLVGVAPFMASVWSNSLVGNPEPLSYIPNPLLGYSNDMTFLQKVHNAVFTFVGELQHNLYHLPKQDAIMRKYFDASYPPIKEILSNVSLVLVNHHYSLAFPRPYVPNMVEIGGYHIPPVKELPKDLKKYFDDSKDGFILFSMGSNLKSAQLPPQFKDSIISAFSKLKQNVIWKFEDDTLTNLPKNVRVMKWLPQSDILAHPNIKLFITHGGLLSTTEAVYRGVPVVGIPIFGDQPINMKTVQNAGLGRMIEFEDLSEEVLLNAVNEVIHNQKYMENAKLRSQLLKDTPLPAMDTAIYWIEYVIRHKGAPHLRSAAQDLAWYQLYLLDVLAVLALAAAAVLTVQFYTARWLLRKLCGKKQNKTDKQKKKN